MSLYSFSRLTRLNHVRSPSFIPLRFQSARAGRSGLRTALYGTVLMAGSAVGGTLAYANYDHQFKRTVDSYVPGFGSMADRSAVLWHKGMELVDSGWQKLKAVAMPEKSDKIGIQIPEQSPAVDNQTGVEQKSKAESDKLPANEDLNRQINEINKRDDDKGESKEKDTTMQTLPVKDEISQEIQQELVLSPHVQEEKDQPIETPSSDVPTTTEAPPTNVLATPETPPSTTEAPPTSTIPTPVPDVPIAAEAPFVKEEVESKPSEEAVNTQDTKAIELVQDLYKDFLIESDELIASFKNLSDALCTHQLQLKEQPQGQTDKDIIIGSITGTEAAVENAKERLEKALKAQYDISVKLASATATVGQGDEANELVDKVCHTVGEYTAKFIEEEEEVNKVQESILKLIQERSKNETLSGEAVAIEVEKIKTEIEAEKQLEINRLLKNQQLEFEIAMNKKMADTLQEKDEQFKKELEYLEKELERNFSEELKDQLLMQNEAHRYHLNDSLMRQASELTEQLNSEFSSKLGKVMDDHQLQMAKALAHLKGIQSMIDTVAEAHDSSRRQKSVKAASDVLVTALVNINKDSDPLAKHSITQEISNLSEVAKDDPFIQTIISSLPQEALSEGISSEIGLKKRFERVKKICSRVALVPEEGGGLGMYLLSYLQSLLTIDMFHPKMIDLSRHDPQESSTFQLLYQAKVHLDSNDVETAVRLVNQLRGESRRVASDWLTEAVLYLEIKQAVMAITEYLAASNVTILQ